MAIEENRGTRRGDASARGAAGYDAAPGARPSIPDAGTSAFGRTPADFATDQPAGKSDLNRGPDGGGLPGTDDVTGGWLGTTKVDPDTGGDIRQGRRRELHPEIDPDTRLGLQPTISSDSLPDPAPADTEFDPAGRMMTGAVAGLIAEASMLVLVYLLMAAGQIGMPAFLASERSLFGWHGPLDHVLAIAGALITGVVFGGIFGAIVRRPNLVNGVIYAFARTIVLWLLLKLTLGVDMLQGGSTQGVLVTLVFDVLIWGAIVGRQCRHWLRPPYSTAVSPIGNEVG